MTIANKSIYIIFILMVIAVAAIILPKASETSVTFMQYDHSDDILRDPDVDYILKSSLFEDVQTSISHSASKHPKDQELKNRCLSDKGTPVLGMVNPQTKHCVEIIQTEVKEGGHTIQRFLVRVVKQVDGIYNEITAFSDEWVDIRQVENYLNEVGYMQMWP